MEKSHCKDTLPNVDPSHTKPLFQQAPKEPPAICFPGSRLVEIQPHIFKIEPVPPGSERRDDLVFFVVSTPVELEGD